MNIFRTRFNLLFILVSMVFMGAGCPSNTDQSTDLSTNETPQVVNDSQNADTPYESAPETNSLVSQDEKRIVNVKVLQTAIELYFNLNATYPVVQSWGELTEELKPFMTAMPSADGKGDVYIYFVKDNTDGYVIGTVLDTYHSGLNQDSDQLYDMSWSTQSIITSTDDSLDVFNCSDEHFVYCLQSTQ